MRILLLLWLVACGSTGSDDCVCTEEYAPVCGEDGETYSNACFATCADVDFTDGACDSGL